MPQGAALDRLHRQTARDAKEIAYLRAALADLRGCAVDYLDDIATGKATPPPLAAMELYAALRRSAAVLRGERDVEFSPRRHEK